MLPLMLSFKGRLYCDYIGIGFFVPFVFWGAVRVVSVENNKRNVSNGSRLGTNCDAMLMSDIINAQMLIPKTHKVSNLSHLKTHNMA